MVSEKKVTFARPFSFAFAAERGESSSPDYFTSSLGSLFRQNYFIIIMMQPTIKYMHAAGTVLLTQCTVHDSFITFTDY